MLNAKMSGRYVHHDPILSAILNTKPEEEIVKEDKVSSDETNDLELSEANIDAREDFDISNDGRLEGLTEEVRSIDRSQSSGKIRWTKIKTIVNNTQHENAFAVGSSITDQEQKFLNLLNSSKSKRNVYKLSFGDIVDAAISRARLRHDLSIRLSKLTMKEVEFLKKIVNDENVTKQQLETADHVLNTDPLYRLPGEKSSFDKFESKKMIQEELVSDDIKPTKSTAKEVLTGHRIHVDGTEIEVLLIKKDDSRNSLIVDGRRMSLLGTAINMSESPRRMSILTTTSAVSELSPSAPAKFSYKTWNLKDSILTKPLLGITDDVDESSLVLSPPMIASIRKSLPFVVREDTFWLKYTMNRDGASLKTVYNSIRQSSRTLLAIETCNGEVFGAFVSSPWRPHTSFYGSCEAFLWRLSKSRFTPTSSLEAQRQIESDIDVFTWSQENRNVQMSDETKIVIGGGFPENDDDESDKWGLGIALGADLYEGTSCPCVTFKSPGLAQISPKGDVFEVSNMEVWTFTPCMNTTEAEQLEMGRMFVLSHFDKM